MGMNRWGVPHRGRQGQAWRGVSAAFKRLAQVGWIFCLASGLILPDPVSRAGISGKSGSSGARGSVPAAASAWEFSIVTPDEAGLSRAIGLLRESPTGRVLVEKAMRVWGAHSIEELLGHFAWGYASRTDAVLIRHYDWETGRETRERRMTVYLRAGQTEGDLILDIAHELIHATSQPLWDPYDPDLTAVKYIRAAIEGRGGEVEAVMAECQVGLELLAGQGRCRDYHGKSARERIRRDFYRVGRWSGELRAWLGADGARLPELSSERPALYSSTGGAPYPVALLKEYRQITAAACENSLKRVGARAGRAPATDSPGVDPQTRAFLDRRCSGGGAPPTPRVTSRLTPRLTSGT